jgi:hypothetical protein
MRLIIDRTTGTVLSASDCYLVESGWLSADELETLEDGADSEIGAVAVANGVRILTAVNPDLMKDEG